MWQNMLDDGSKELFKEEDEIKLTLFEKCCDVLFDDIIKTYVKMELGEYLRGFWRDIEWKKWLRHIEKSSKCGTRQDS